MKSLSSFFIIAIMCQFCMTCNKKDVLTEMYSLDRELGQALFYYHTQDYQKLDTQVGSMLINMDQLELKIEDANLEQSQFSISEAKECLVWVKSDLYYNKYKNAFYDLDRFRYKLIAFRSENDLEYAMDYLWDIEALIEIVNSSIELKNDCPVNWYEYVDVSLCLKTDYIQFQTLINEQKDLSGIQMQNPYYKTSINNFQYSINDFEDAVIDTNWKQLQNSAKQLNRDYLNLLYNISFEETENFVASY